MRTAPVESSSNAPSPEARPRASHDPHAAKGAFRERLEGEGRRPTRGSSSGEPIGRSSTRGPAAPKAARPETSHAALGAKHDHRLEGEALAEGRRTTSATEPGPARPEEGALPASTGAPSQRSRRDRARAERDESALPADGAAFTPLPPVLLPPATTAAAPPTGPRTAPAELAALADRLLRSLRVGRLADGTAMVRLQLDGGRRGDVHVELRQTEAGLSAVVEATDGDRAHASEWAERLEGALSARGLDLRSVELA
jgi:hypothetical protein